MAVFKNKQGKYCVQFNKMNKKFWMGSFTYKRDADKIYKNMLQAYEACRRNIHTREARMRTLANIAKELSRRD